MLPSSETRSWNTYFKLIGFRGLLRRIVSFFGEDSHLRRFLSAVSKPEPFNDKPEDGYMRLRIGDNNI